MRGEFAIAEAFQSESDKVLNALCEMVACLAKNSDEFRAEMGKQDVIKDIIDLVKNEDPAYHGAALRALWALCLNNEIHQVITRASGMIEFLLGRLAAHDTTIQQKPPLLKALSSICSGHCKFLFLWPSL